MLPTVLWLKVPGLTNGRRRSGWIREHSLSSPPPLQTRNTDMRSDMTWYRTSYWKKGFHIGIHIGLRHSHRFHIGNVSDYWNIVSDFLRKTKCVQFHRFHIGSVSECWPFMSDFSTKNKKYPVPSEWYRKRRSLWRQSRKNDHFPTRSSLGCCKIRWTFLLLVR